MSWRIIVASGDTEQRAELKKGATGIAENLEALQGSGRNS